MVDLPFRSSAFLIGLQLSGGCPFLLRGGVAEGDADSQDDDQYSHQYY
jgi:hypothetical protein